MNNFERHKDPIESMKIGVRRNAIYIDCITVPKFDHEYALHPEYIGISKEASLEKLQRICYGPFPVPVHELDMLLDGEDLSSLQGKEIIYAGELFKLPTFWEKP